MLNEGSPEQDKDHPIGKKHHKKKHWKTLHKMDKKMIKDYIAHLDESGLSTKTLKSYEDKAAADAKKRIDKPKPSMADFKHHSKRYRGIQKSQSVRMDRAVSGLKKTADDLHKATKDYISKKQQNENFMDGKNPQDKGDSKRHGLSGKMSTKSLKKARSSSNSSPRKKQLAHWLLNMRKGREKS